MYTSEERAFIGREFADLRLAEFPEVPPDTLHGDKQRSLAVIQKVLEKRAKILGARFTDFQRKLLAPVEPPADLDRQVQAAKLW